MKKNYKKTVVQCIVLLVFQITPLFLYCQSIWKSEYSNSGSYTVDLGYSNYTNTPFSVFSLSGEMRALYVNLGFDLAVGAEESQNPYPAFVNGKIGVALPLYHQKLASSTLNFNSVAYSFQEGQDVSLTGWGWELYAKYNTTFGNVKIGYNKSPDLNLQLFDLNGFFVRLGIGFNKFAKHSQNYNWNDWKYSFANNHISVKPTDPYAVYTPSHVKQRKKSPNYIEDEAIEPSYTPTEIPLNPIDPAYLEDQKRKWSENGIDDIEGQYDHFSGTSKIKFDIIVKKTERGYKFHFYGCSFPLIVKPLVAKLSTGDVIAELNPTAINGIYKGRYYHPDGRSFDITAKFNGLTITTLIEDGYTGIEDVYLKIYPSVDDEIIKQPIREGSGTGFSINSNGYIATNYHVIEGAKRIKVKVNNGSIVNAKVVSTDTQNDLAIIKIDSKTTSPKYGFKTEQSDVGEEVFALGYPMTQTLGEELKYTDGNISSLSGSLNDINLYQITVPIQPGNSGGPLFDIFGNVVGITSSGIRDGSTQNVNYAIKLRLLESLIKSDPTINFMARNIKDRSSIVDKVKNYRSNVYKIIVNY